MDDLISVPTKKRRGKYLKMDLKQESKTINKHTATMLYMLFIDREKTYKNTYKLLFIPGYCFLLTGGFLSAGYEAWLQHGL